MLLIDIMQDNKTSEDLRKRLSQIQQKVAESCAKSGRQEAEVSILPISKTKASQVLKEAASLGLHRFGENKVQEMSQKAEELSGLSLEWVLVGHLQSNKAKQALVHARELQSLDSLKLAEKLERHLQEMGKSIDVLLQVNTSFEPQKEGLALDEVLEFSRKMSDFSCLKVKGLMTLAVFSEEEKKVRACFKRLKNLQELLRQESPLDSSWEKLSMGMSGDYQMAIEEGATEIRLGQALFGARS